MSIKLMVGARVIKLCETQSTKRKARTLKKKIDQSFSVSFQFLTKFLKDPYVSQYLITLCKTNFL